MAGLEIRELESFLALARELHFGRAGERLYVSQSRVSQLLRALETRIGARLVDRTSRRVCLTPAGERFLADLLPAYETLRTAVEVARAEARGVDGRLRLGFQGTADAPLMRAITAFQDRHPGCVTEIAEISFSDPFGAVRRGEVDGRSCCCRWRSRIWPSARSSPGSGRRSRCRYVTPSRPAPH